MGIGYARLEMISRSAGKNMIAKSAYNSREEMAFDGNCVLEAKNYNFSNRESVIHHEVMLPEGADKSFLSSKFLWSHAESKEKRINSQVGAELLIALPDDACVSDEMRLEMLKAFAKEHIIDRGLAAQIDIHQPEKVVEISKDGKSKAVSWHNNHAHVLIPTRYFHENGKELGKKARDFFGQVAKGKVISANRWGDLWAEHQNQYFKDKGLVLKVDQKGIIPQRHIGPQRMRGKDSYQIQLENERIKELNKEISKDVSVVLRSLTENQSVFTREDVDHFLNKHLATESIEDVRNRFWNQEGVVELLKSNKETSGKFSSIKVIEEEKHILRLADRMVKRPGLKLKINSKVCENLNKEQKAAFQELVKGQRLSCLQGYAGTGKSYLFLSLKEAYESKNYAVRVLGADQHTADVLKDKGFSHAENVHRFLFRDHFKSNIESKEVWLIDEAGKLSNPVLLELFKKAEQKQAQVILSGDYAQLPSVARGGMFKVLCQRYGSANLQDVQRQNDVKFREFVKKLSNGELGHVIQSLHHLEHIKWTHDKDDAIKSMVRDWERSKIPPLLVAYTNNDVKAINDAVHLLRKEKGEIQEEHACLSYHGKIFVSVGDAIEFRANDRELGILNHMRGTLIRAEKDCFSVKIEEKKNQARIVNFNPKEFHQFQLGYAVTCVGSQGITEQKVSVLHNKSASREGTYVAFSRHVEDVNYYVPKDQTKNLSKLKSQIQRSQYKDNTLNYLDPRDLKQKARVQERQKELNKLKGSPSYWNKFKGYSLDLFDKAKKQGTQVSQKYRDRMPNDGFFQDGIVNAQKQKELFGKIKLSEEESTSNISKKHGNQKEQEAKILPNEHFPQRVEDGLSKSLSYYFKQAKATSQIYSHQKADLSKVEDWKKACGKRNALAHGLKAQFDRGALRGKMGSEAYSYLSHQAEKHQSFLESRHRMDRGQIEDALKQNISGLCFSLFPEGCFSKQGSSLRFGKKGSLKVQVDGSSKGNFYDFENAQGGGPIQLIKNTHNCSREDAFSLAREFLGEARQMPIPEKFCASKSEEKQWILEEMNHLSAPNFSRFKSLQEKFNEVARHVYKDENGRTLGYRLRLIDKETGDKALLPLSYGHFKGEERSQWKFKEFQPSEKRTLYRLEELEKDPFSKVLILEGEKTTDFAQTRLEKLDRDFICVTWSGGSNAVTKTDWSPLAGREVYFWPDNDKAGFDVAKPLYSELRKVGVKKLEEIDQKKLSGSFPEKWDLADPLPPGKTEKDLKDFFFSTNSKACDPERMLIFQEFKKEELPFKMAQANEVLWRVDERLREGLEEKHGSRSYKINNEIEATASCLFSNQEALKKQLRGVYSINEKFLEKLAYQVTLFKAENGKDPNQEEIKNFKTFLQGFGHKEFLKKEFDFSKNLSSEDKKNLSFLADKKIHEFLEGKYEVGKEVFRDKFQKELKDSYVEFSKNLERQQTLQRNLEKQRELEKSMDRGMER